MQAAPHRFELYRGIVSCYLALQRSREAINMAASSLHHIGNCPRTFTVNHIKRYVMVMHSRNNRSPLICFMQLYGSVLLRDPVQSSKGKVFLERALTMDPGHIQATFLLSEFYDQVCWHPDHFIRLRTYLAGRKAEVKLPSP